MIDLSRMRLGCRWPPGRVHSPVAVAAGERIPQSWSRVTGAPRVMGQNDTIGDCVPTACANAIVDHLAAQSGADVPAVPNEEVVRVYSEVTGYTPSDPSTDRGTDPLVMFAWWHQHAISGFLLDKFWPIDPKSEYAVRATIKRNGGAFLVGALPTEAQNERTWIAAGVPGSWGYHAVWVDSFVGPSTFGTSWGDPQPIDQTFFPRYVVGAYGLSLKTA